jgi:medium-chain acyl-[acyl-carrier-protein] hydrolase
VNQTPSNSNKWLVCPRGNPEAEARLFIFPYAGAGPAAFGKWTSGFPDDIELWLIHYPGRGSRHTESPIKELAILVESTQQAIWPLLDKPFAFFGHSLGGLVAFELSRSLTQANLPQPNVLFISACGAPHLPDPNPPIHALPDSEFTKALQDLNGTPEEISTHSELMEILLPTLRADFEAAENYQYNSSERPLACPIVTFGGGDDPRVSRERMEGWASQTSSGFKSIYFPGDHFYFNSVQDEIVKSIIREMMFSLKFKRNPG